MLVSTNQLLTQAQQGGYAVGAFNVYNLEAVQAVVKAAELTESPAMLQLHPAALKQGGVPLITLCLTAAKAASVPISVHLDHSDSVDDIQMALDCNILSIMADGSHLSYEANVAFTQLIATLTHQRGGVVEAELGRLSGTEDDLTVSDNEARLTDPDQAAEFVQKTGADALAICIGNVHGRYQGTPHLDFERLMKIQAEVSVPLVLHGASGLPKPMIQRAIALGITKFNVNTDLRQRYLTTLQASFNQADQPELLALMQATTSAMTEVVIAKLHLFGSAGQAKL
ncbi:MAG: class II fructose-bisphosphate aldolase [Chloroflexota bacterium]